MTTSKLLPTTLAGWLEYIEALHPKSIAMGLERVQQLVQRLNLTPDFPIITVAGTNGKGSTSAMLERIYACAGYRVACYTSPHLLRYNERVRVDCQEISDHELCSAFSIIEAAREGIQLTYFEYGTLAAVWHFMQAKVDVAILEVGLGGRLDAVNAFEPSCSIVTNIDLDHTEFLGDTRESIGFEKAGIFRPNIPAICGDPLPPESLITHAQNTGAVLRLIERDFNFKYHKHLESHANFWEYSVNIPTATYYPIAHLPMPLLVGEFQLYNAACVIAAIQSIAEKLPIKLGHIADAFNSVQLLGRFQQYEVKPPVILDVAHNPHAAKSLAANLRNFPCIGKTIAVFAMLADKDIGGVISEVGDEIDAWYVAGIANARGAQVGQIAELITLQFPCIKILQCEDVAQAYHQACMDAGENDRIIVLGSFFTVADVMRLLPQARHQH